MRSRGPAIADHGTLALFSALSATTGPGAAETLRIALLGALVGGALTIAGDVAVRLFFGRRRTASMRKGLTVEAERLRKVAQDRQDEHSAGIALRAPLPTRAWEALLTRGDVSALGDRERERFLDLYEQVDEANFLSREAGLLFAVAQVVEHEAAAGLEAEATRLSTSPNIKVIAAADRVLLTSGDE